MKIKFHIVITILIVIASCSKPKERPCWKFNGEIISITSEWSQTHHTIELKDDINLILINDSLNYLTIEGPENLIEFIDVSFGSENMILSNLNRCDFLRKPYHVNVYYHYTELNRVDLKGYGTLSNENEIHHNISIHGNESFSDVNLQLQNDSTILTFMKGSTSVLLSGTCNYLYGYSSGLAPFDAGSLICNKAHGHSTGLGNFYLNATDQLTIELRSMGNFYYSGNPIITNFIQTGTGIIINQH